MGRCIRRDCWIDGRVRRAGYLAELRLDESARGRFRILRDGYGFFRALQRDNPASLYFTSIAADNERARRLLERGVAGMPVYQFLAELDTVVAAVPRRPRRTSLHVEPATPSHLPELLRLLNDQGRQRQLAAVWTAEDLHTLERHGLPLLRFLLGFANGELVACGAMWDQRSFRQIVIRGYSSALSIARPWINAVGHLFGTVQLPPVGTIFAQALLSPLAFAQGAEGLLPDFVGAAFPFAAQTGIEFLTLALPTADRRLPVLRRRFSTRTWRSRLYRVAWPEHAAFEFQNADAPFLPDIAFL
jgi:hypothetical protein